MKIHLYFADNINFLEVVRDDIYLITSSTLYNDLRTRVLHCFLININDGKHSEEYINSFSNLFFQLEKDSFLTNDIFFRGVLQLSNIIFQVNLFVNTYNADSIVLYGGNTIPFLSFSSTEGEVGYPFLYKREWMMNYYVYLLFGDKFKIIWKNKTAKLKLVIIYYFRIFVLFFYHCSLLINQSLRKTIKNNNSILNRLNSKTIIAFVDLKLQYNHLKDLLKTFTDIQISFISNNRIDKNVILTEYLSVSEWMSIINREFKRTYNDVNVTFPGIGSFTITGKVLKRSMFYSFFFSDVNSKRLIKSINILSKRTQILLFINDKTMGQDAFIDKNIASVFDKRIITFQYVMMPHIAYPSYKMYDIMCFASEYSVQFFKKHITNSFNYQSIPIAPIKKLIYNKKRVITLFLQPDNFADCSLEYALLLSKLVLHNSNILLNIKPHYRQNNNFLIINKINSLSNFDPHKIHICDMDESVIDVLNNSDISIGFTSAVLLESVFRGVPTISIAIDDFICKIIKNDRFLNSDVVFKVYTISDLEKAIISPNSIYDSFCIAREQYLLHNDSLMPEDILKRFIQQ